MYQPIELQKYFRVSRTANFLKRGVSNNFVVLDIYILYIAKISLLRSFTLAWCQISILKLNIFEGSNYTKYYY